ncbi:DUF3997 domain-containing protein [Polaribacter aestuariivivens]|uniref:DUF3997 domain-containing protein n=1 Tax=Polaribacter aestuariivivens TaxID=2304626 RepID=UPI003F498875
MKKIIVLILSIILFQSCYFGAGVVEVDLPGSYFLFGNNSIDETAIFFETGEYSSDVIVEETVFAIGFNKKFIIAKSYTNNSKFMFEDKNPKILNGIQEDDLISYHILDLREKNPKKSKGMNFTEYVKKRRDLKISEKLNFTIILKQNTIK